MSAEVSRIKEVWQQGERLSLDGQHPEALLHFQRAKALLLVESKALFGSDDVLQFSNNAVSGKGGSTSKLMGDILTQLTGSINRDVKLMNANPVHALGLKRGFTKADVKKAYRIYALKYHPDKNTDCDSSCVFSAIQSSYEKLNATLDAADTGTGAAVGAVSPRGTRNGPGSKSNAGSGSTFAYQDFPMDGAQSGSRFYQSHKDIGRRGTGPWNASSATSSGSKNGSNTDEKQRSKRHGQDPSPYEFDQTRTARDRARRDSKDGPSNGTGPEAQGVDQKKTNTATASTVSGMTSEHLRVLLKQFGLPPVQVDGMGRADLIKKYLFACRVLGAAQGSNESAAKDENDLFGEDDAFTMPPPPTNFSSGGADSDRSKSSNTSKSSRSADAAMNAFERTAQQWAEAWTKQVSEQLDREKRATQTQKQNRGPIPTYRQGSVKTSTASSFGTSSGVGQVPKKSNDNPVPGYEFTHVPGVAGGGVNRGAATASPYASTYYTQKQQEQAARNRREKELKANIEETKAELRKTRRMQVEENDEPDEEETNDAKQRERAGLADAMRAERAGWLKEKLPAMAVAELRRIMQTSGLELNGCVDRQELVSRLSRHYGLGEVQISSVSVGAASGGIAGNGTGRTPAEAALQSKLASPRTGRPDLLSSRPSSSSPSFAPPVDMPVKARMDDDALRKVLAAATASSGTDGKRPLMQATRTAPYGDLELDNILADAASTVGRHAARSGARLGGASEWSDALPRKPHPRLQPLPHKPSEPGAAEDHDRSDSSRTASEEEGAERISISTARGALVDDEDDNEDDTDDEEFLNRLRQRGWDLGDLMTSGNGSSIDPAKEVPTGKIAPQGGTGTGAEIADVKLAFTVAPPIPQLGLFNQQVNVC